MANNLPIRIGNRNYSWYSYGHMAFNAANPDSYPSPKAEGIHPHYTQGWVAAAKQRLKVFGPEAAKRDTL